MKNRINWGILLWAGFLILLNMNIKNIKYLPNLLKELHRLWKKNSKYSEDGDFILIHKSKRKKNA
jgi:hypothetical protein